MGDKPPLPYPATPPNGQALFKFSLLVYLSLLERCGVKQAAIYDTRGTI
jgi:hypothetical protein